ncbi:CmpA/NrtA family ABC transporter substrate-binding protein [Halomonas sp. YLGW01]|uniref:CmpA/NrtA family ABC transporter substrate-binding protein n=1 Tax=Halomonas sp. YLGW01 TaxID=2773308 RepID=UPI001784E1B9|nr:CmpA/NrtA family ABC transporter substrate-binding protein [Halomonas sp. YLGW01]
MTMPQDAELDRLTLGFVPLIDCALLVVAREQGCFADQGLEVTLSRQNAWSTLRDRVAAGLLDGAQMLAPLPLAMSLGLGRAPCDTLAPITLGRHGNTIALSHEIAEASGARLTEDPATSARALAAYLTLRGDRRLRLAMVYPHSCQHYQLRQWLSLGGIDPDEDVEITVLPPPQMVEALAAGRIDGFCVGEPWGSLAESQQAGRLVATGAQLWPGSPEKVLGVTRSWAHRYPATLARLIRALRDASEWLMADPAHLRKARDWLALPPYLDRSMNHLETLALDSGHIAQQLYGPGILRPDPDAAGRFAEHMDQQMRRHGRRLDRATLEECYSPVHFDAATHQ